MIRKLNNNLKYDIWGNYLMSRQLGPRAGYGYLARKSVALCRAVIMNRTVMVNNKEFYDTWG